jgi:radical SAM superfamily enzyme YgiQ (UPF0313 family)
MRILLVGPEREENLSLRYLSGSLLAAGHESHLVTFDSLEDLPMVVERARGIEAIGLSLCFQARAREFLALAAALKLFVPKATIVVGGHYATCAAEELLAHHPDLDVIVLHEGERTLVELADARFDSARFPEIAGLAYRVDAQVRRSAPRPKITELDALPFPDRRGPERRHAGVPTAYLMGSRGCYSSCDYCCIATLHRVAPGPNFRQRSVENITDEMAALYHERGVRQFVFHDDNFLVPSVRRNHERLDAFAAAWAARGMKKIGFTLKCRPSEVDRSVFEKLIGMGLLRVFLGIESGSAQGLDSIGRHGSGRGRDADLADGEAALRLCQELKLSTQYTLMCFHPNATVETVREDLAFFRRHLQHALNFCRVETYAGTPIEARLRAEGRGRGNYLARTYTISDPAIERAAQVATRLFQRRCWANDSLMELTIGLDYLASVLTHYHSGPGLVEARNQVQAFTLRVNRDLVTLLDELLQVAIETTGHKDPAFSQRMHDLVTRERLSCDTLLREGVELRNAVRSLGMAASAREARRPSATRRGITPLKSAAAFTLAATLTGCGISEGAVSEYAPLPMKDTDGDGLPDQCETEIFGTDPLLADTDGDGTPDGHENHDGGALDNIEEQQRAGDYACADAPDMVSEAAPTPLVDTDGDGLPDQCETEIFGTDPHLVDTDGNGTPDGQEDHDGLGMSNLDEQKRVGDDRCFDVDESKP